MHKLLQIYTQLHTLILSDTIWDMAANKSVILAEVHDKMFRLEMIDGRYYVTMPRFEKMLVKRAGKRTIVPFFELKKFKPIIDDLFEKATKHAKAQREKK